MDSFRLPEKIEFIGLGVWCSFSANSSTISFSFVKLLPLGTSIIVVGNATKLKTIKHQNGVRNPPIYANIPPTNGPAISPNPFTASRNPILLSRVSL